MTLFSNLGLKLLSLFLAILVWGVVLGSKVEEVVKEVPIEFQVAQDLMVSNQVPDRVIFRLSGPRAFTRSVLNRQGERIRYNLTGMKAGNLSLQVLSDSIYLPPGVEVLSITPNVLQVKLEEIRSKLVDVSVEFRGEPPRGFKLKSTRVVPSQVKIRGPKSKLTGLRDLKAMPFDLNEVQKSGDYPLQFELNQERIEIDDVQPRLLLELQGIAGEYRIRNIPIRITGAPGNLKPSATNVSLWIKSTEESMRLLRVEKLEATVNASGVGDGGKRDVEVKLPKEVQLIRVIPKDIQFAK
jgi:YbbR domain-containing protein